MAKKKDRREATRETQDRREFQRIEDKDISIQFKSDEFDILTQSLDVSASGIYCKIRKEVPLMTRFEIVLALPNRKKDAPPKILKVEGVVVREHPVVRDGKVQHYDVALFFNSIKPEERELIVKYINKRTD